ncbi:MAG: hypothetical protein WC119_02540 [Synergistaceae bacterium]
MLIKYRNRKGLYGLIREIGIMRKVMFNLKQFRRKAYYEDAKALISGQTRDWMNCYKIKVGEGIAPQKAIESCMKEYQTLADGDWSFKYASKIQK